jgi:hypothetical protein
MATVPNQEAPPARGADRLTEIETEIRATQGAAIIKIGEKLHEAREIFRYDRNEGGFEGWVESRLTFSRRTAYNMIDAFTRLSGESVQNLHTLSRTVLYELAAPSTPDEVRQEVVQRAEAGQNVTHKDVLELKRKLKEAKAKAKESAEVADMQKTRADQLAAQGQDLYKTKLMLEDSVKRLQEQLRTTPPAIPAAAPPLKPVDPTLEALRALWRQAGSATRQAFLLDVTEE